MIAFDTDVLSDWMRGRANYVKKAEAIPPTDRYVPTVVVEEVFRARLAAVRRAESGKTKISLVRAYGLFQATVSYFSILPSLPFDDEAHTLFQQWRKAGIRIGTHDLRIAATCVAANATLVTRNRRDFDMVPDLQVEYWN